MESDNSLRSFQKAIIFTISAVGMLALAWLIKIFRLMPKTPNLPKQEENEMPTRSSQNLPAVSPEMTTVSSVQSQPNAPLAKPATTWSNTTKYIVGVILFLGFLFVIFISHNVLSTLILAFLLSFILAPIIKFFQNRLKMRRGSAILITYILLLLLILLTPIVILPALVNGVQAFVNFLQVELPSIANNVINWTDTTANDLASNPFFNATIVPALNAISAAVSGLASINENPAYVPTINLDTTIQTIGSRLGQVLGVLTTVLGPLVSTITTLGFTLLISLHMSLAADAIHDNYLKVVPEPYQPEIKRLVERLLLVWNAFLRGQISLMIVIGVIVYLGNLALGSPQALFLGLLSGFLEVIPTLGPILATIPAIILALIFGSSYLPVPNWVFAIFVLIFYLVVQMLENQLIVPRIMGDAVDIPPLVVIIGCMVGGSIAGILGVFLAAPVIASAKVIVGYLYDKILEKPPLPPDAEPEQSLLDSVRGWLAKIPRPRAERKTSIPES